MNKTKRQLTKPAKTKEIERLYLSSGSTPLDINCSGKIGYAFISGHYYQLAGDSSSGKTWVCLNILAEASVDDDFASYRLIYDAAERKPLMSIAKYYGKALKQRLEPPEIANGEAVYSATDMDFYQHVDDALSDDQPPCIYVLDSWDALSAVEDRKKYAADKKAYQKGDDIKGDYNLTKQKRISARMKDINNKLRQKNSFLFIISQSRANITNPFEPRTSGGGDALTFYAVLRLFSSRRGKIKTPSKVGSKQRVIGNLVQVAITKNHQTGNEGAKVLIPIYKSYGIDDIGSCIDYLLEEGHWKKVSGGKIKAKEFNKELRRDDLISYIESHNREGKLRMIVGKVWRAIEEQCEIKRKPRY